MILVCTHTLTGVTQRRKSEAKMREILLHCNAYIYEEEDVVLTPISLHGKGPLQSLEFVVTISSLKKVGTLDDQNIQTMTALKMI